jgi:hypothetical protein
MKISQYLEYQNNFSYEASDIFRKFGELLSREEVTNYSEMTFRAATFILSEYENDFLLAARDQSFKLCVSLCSYAICKDGLTAKQAKVAEEIYVFQREKYIKKIIDLYGVAIVRALQERESSETKKEKSIN